MKHQHALIDYDYAVKQLGGDKELLFKLLGKFKIQYDNSDAEIIEQINSGDFESAKMRIHTAKGITGSLGLKALYESCRKLDKQLTNQALCSEDLSAFANIMRDTLNEIDSLVSSSTPPFLQEPSTIRSEDSSSLAKQELVELLSRQEFIDDNMLRKLVNKTGMNKDSASSFIALVEGLEYDKAIAFLNT